MSVSLEKATQLINDPDIPDDEIRQIIDACQTLTEILFEKWIQDVKVKNKMNVNNQPTYDSKSPLQPKTSRVI